MLHWCDEVVVGGVKYLARLNLVGSAVEKPNIQYHRNVRLNRVGLGSNHDFMQLLWGVSIE